MIIERTKEEVIIRLQPTVDAKELQEISKFSSGTRKLHQNIKRQRKRLINLLPT
jgi:hypothetical protein